MSDSLWPLRRQPTRLPRPWDSPGKNTGVGCHFLLQCMKVKRESEVTQLCLTLSDPMDCSLPGSSVHGIFQARVLEWGCHCLLWASSVPSCNSVLCDKGKVKVNLLSRVPLFVSPWTVAYQVPPSMGVSRQEYWSGLPFPSPGDLPNPGSFFPPLFSQSVLLRFSFPFMLLLLVVNYFSTICIEIYQVLSSF